MKWFLLGLVILLSGCVAFVTPASTFQFGGRANAAANTGEAGVQRQADPALPDASVDAGHGLGYIKAKQAPASRPTTTQPGR